MDINEMYMREALHQAEAAAEIRRMTGKRGNFGGFTGIFAHFLEIILALACSLWYYISAFRTVRRLPVCASNGWRGG